MNSAPKSNPVNAPAFDAMTASAADVAARLREISEAETRRRFQDRAADTLAQLTARYGADGMAGIVR